MAASITVHLQIFKRPQLLCFSTDLDETGFKIHGLLRTFILNVVGETGAKLSTFLKYFFPAFMTGYILLLSNV